MKLENQVVSLELAKQMKKLGFPQESLWWWIKRPDQKEIGEFYYSLEDGKLRYHDTAAPFSKEDTISAYTVAELGALLPSYISPYISGYDIERIYTERNGGHYRCWFREIKEKHNIVTTSIREFNERTEANARAKLLIYLKQEGQL